MTVQRKQSTLFRIPVATRMNHILCFSFFCYCYTSSVSVFPCYRLLGLPLSNDGHGIFNVRNGRSACCAHEWCVRPPTVGDGNRLSDTSRSAKRVRTATTTAIATQVEVNLRIHDTGQTAAGHVSLTQGGFEP